MPSRRDEAGHTKAFDYPVAEHWAFDYPVAEHWGESQNVQFRGWDSNRQHINPESNALPTEPPRFPPRRITSPRVLNRGDLRTTGGIVSKEQLRHEKAIPMGPNPTMIMPCQGYHSWMYRIKSLSQFIKLIWINLDTIHLNGNLWI